MSEKINNIAKNASYFTFALVLQKVISFTYFAILARTFIPEDIGKYYFAISFATIFAIFIDLGLANVLTREVAKRQDKAEKLLGNVIFVKIPLAILSILLAVLIINLLDYPIITKYLVYLSLTCVLLDSFSSTFYSIIRGFHNLKFESIAVFLFQVIVIIFGLTAIKLNLGLFWVMSALDLASIFNFTYSSFLIRFKWKIKLKPAFDKLYLKSLLIITIPFALFGILQKLYMYLDTVLLSLIAGDKYVGLYQIAFKIIFALQFLPMAFVASLYPAFSSYWKKNKDQLAISFERSINYLIIISLPISAGIIFLSDKIITLFKPEYVEAILPLQIIMVSLIFVFLNFPIGSLLNACDKQKINSINMGITLVASISLNIILIPKFQALGASITVVATNCLMFMLGISVVPKIIKYKFSKNVSILIKSFISVFLMVIFIHFFKEKLNLFVIVLMSGIVYFLVLYLLKGFRKEDILSITNSFFKKSS